MSDDKPIALHSRGDRVAEMQRSLLAAGYSIPQWELDSRTFGNGTKEALRAFQARYDLTVTGIYDELTALALVDWDGDAIVVKNRVSGSMVFDDGRIAAGVTVRAYSRGYGGVRTRLAEGVGDVDGTYALEYAAVTKFRNLEMCVVGKGGIETAVSRVVFNADADQVIDLVVPASIQSLGSEYSRIVADLKTGVGSKGTLLRATELSSCSDVAFLHAATSWDARLIVLAVSAVKLAASEEMDAEALYGLFRAGLPRDEDKLSQLPFETIEAALGLSNEAGITDVDPDRFAASFNEFVAGRRGKLKADGAFSSHQDLLDTTGMDEEAQAVFSSLYFGDADKGQAFWQSLRAKDGFTDELVDRLEITGKLAYLTTDNAPLIDALISNPIGTDTAVGAVGDLVSLGYYEADKWLAALDAVGGAATGDDLPVPPLYTGADDEERKQNYANDLARKVSSAYPTQVIADKFRLGTLTLGDTGADLALATFLDNAIVEGFEFARNPLNLFLVKYPDLETASTSETVAAAKRVQRLYQITPNDDAMQGLLSAGLASAAQVALFSADDFARFVSSFSVSADDAALIYRKAQQVNAVALGTIASVSRMAGGPEVYALTTGKSDRDDAVASLGEQFPTFESSVGSMDYCECRHCRSVLSQSAYFVDLLQFLDPDATVWEHWKSQREESDDAQTPYAVLIERRPDLPYLPLTCENTLTAMPYIDIVNEILECVVAPPDPVPVFDTGDASSEDLLAEPQNVHAPAYDVLRDGLTRYPLGLPFDLWTETTRRFCERFDTTFADLLHAFRSTDELIPESARVVATDAIDVYAAPLNVDGVELSAGDGELIGPDRVLVIGQTERSQNGLYDFAGAGAEMVRSESANDEENLRGLVVVVGEGQDFAGTSWRVANRGEIEVGETAIEFESCDTRAYGIADVFTESLGLSRAQVRLLSDADGTVMSQWYTLFGFEDATALDALVYDKVLARNLEISYVDLARVIGCGFVNPRLHASVLLRNLHVGALEAYEYMAELGGADPSEEALAFQARLTDLLHGSTTFDANAFVDELKVMLVQVPTEGDDRDKGNSVLRYVDGSTATDVDLLKINLLVRLWRALDWSLDEVDRVLTAMSPIAPEDLTVENAGGALRTVLFYMAHVDELSRRLPIEGDARVKITTFWVDLPTAGKNPLYDRLFLSGNELDRDEAFVDPLGDYLTADEVYVKDHIRALRGGTGLTSEEIWLVLDDVADDGDEPFLSMANVSALYRHGLLARALGIAAADVRTLIYLTGIDPFEELVGEPVYEVKDDVPYANTLRFVEIAEAIKESGLSIEDLAYLLYHQFDPVGTYRVDPQAVPQRIDAIRERIEATRAEYAALDDETAETNAILFEKLGWLLPVDVVEGFETIWTEADSFSDAEIAAFAEAHLAGFITAVDFAALFAPIPDDPPVDEDEVWLARRTSLIERFLPYAREQVIRRAVTDLLVIETEAVDGVGELLLTDTDVLIDPTWAGEPRPLVDAVLTAEENGAVAAFYDAERTLIETLYVDAVDTAIKPDASSSTVQAISAVYEGCLVVPVDGTYDFTAVLDAGTSVEFRFAFADEPILAGTAGSTAEETTASVGLTAGVPYAFTMTAENLDAGLDVVLEVGGAIPRTGLDALPMYPVETVERIGTASTLLAKAAVAVGGLGLTARELLYFATHADDFDGFDLNLIPTEAVDKPAEVEAPLFEPILRIGSYAALKEQIAGGTDDLIDVFEAAQVVFPVGTDAAKAAEDVIEAAISTLAGIVRRSDEMVTGATEYLGYHVESKVDDDGVVVRVPDLIDERALRRMRDVLTIASQIGVTVGNVEHWATPEPGESQVRDLRYAVRAQFTESQWRLVARPIFDAVRRRKRDALAAKVMHAQHLKSIDELFEFYLIDPGMEPVVQTSRLRLAISAVQTFIQRCLMGLEDDVAPSAINAAEWEWMKRYRVWEANRKIFLFPENWLEPEFRDDKTHLFSELEGALLQNDITNDLAEDAFFVYLRGLGEIARLEIVSVYTEEDEADAQANVLHVIGRTYNLPHAYFYRRHAHGMWTPWEKVEVEIEGDHVVAAVWRGRLWLFWAVFLEKPGEPGTMPKDLRDTKMNEVTIGEFGKASASGTPARNVEVRLNWSEYFQGEWTSRESGAFGDPISVTVTSDAYKKAPIWVHKVEQGGEEGAVHVCLGSPIDKSFRLAGRNDVARPAAPRTDPGIPYYASQDHVSAAFVTHSDLDEDAGLFVYGAYARIVESNTGSIQCVTVDNRPSAPTWYIGRFINPFFCQDGKHTLFAEPDLSEPGIDQWEGWTTFFIYIPPPFVPSDDDSHGGIQIARQHRQIELAPPEVISQNFGDAIHDIDIPADWTINDITLIEFGGRLIGPNGPLDVYTVPVDARIGSRFNRIGVNLIACNGASGTSLVANAGKTSYAKDLIDSGRSVAIVGPGGVSRGLVDAIDQQRLADNGWDPADGI